MKKICHLTKVSSRRFFYLHILISLLAMSALFGCGTSPKTPIIKAEQLSQDSTLVPPPPDIPLPPEGQRREDQAYTEAFGTPEYTVGPGDVLEISIWVGLEEQKHTVPVQPDGTITFAYLDNVRVSSLTIKQIRDVLLKKLSEYIKRPRVNVSVKEYQSKMVSLFGEIKGGHYPLRGKTTVLDLVIRAGADLTKAGLKNVRIIRGGKTYEINLYRTIFQGDESQNVVLEAGDVVIVAGLSSPANQVHVLGEVKTPGAYPYKYDMNLVGALSQAGGLTDVGVSDNILVVRGGLEKPMLIASNMKGFLEKADFSQNIRLQGGDVVYVPRTLIGDINSFAKKLMPVLYMGRMPAEYWYMYRGEFVWAGEQR